jgi:hypothetical protein
MTMLTAKNPCEHFHTMTGAHKACAHLRHVALMTDFRCSDEDRDNYTQAEMWMSVTEAQEVIRVLGLAIAATQEYQAAQIRPADAAGK